MTDRMKYSLVTTKRFKKDYKRAIKRGLDVSELDSVLKVLLDGEVLDARHNDHALTGEYDGFRECHIRPDWLLVYAIYDDELILVASRTGTHSDLFD